MEKLQPTPCDQCTTVMCEDLYARGNCWLELQNAPDKDTQELFRLLSRRYEQQTKPKIEHTRETE